MMYSESRLKKGCARRSCGGLSGGVVRDLPTKLNIFSWFLYALIQRCKNLKMQCMRWFERCIEETGYGPCMCCQISTTVRILSKESIFVAFHRSRFFLFCVFSHSHVLCSPLTRFLIFLWYLISPAFAPEAARSILVPPSLSRRPVLS